MPQLVTLYRYRSLAVPPQEKLHEPDPKSPKETSLESFTRQLNELSSAGQAVQLITLPGFLLAGEVAGFAALEQTIMPGVMPGAGPPLNRRN